MTPNNLDQKPLKSTPLTPYLIATSKIAEKFNLQPKNRFYARYFHQGELDVQVESIPILHNANPYRGDTLVAVIEEHPHSAPQNLVNLITLYNVSYTQYKEIEAAYKPPKKDKLNTIAA